MSKTVKCRRCGALLPYRGWGRTPVWCASCKKARDELKKLGEPEFKGPSLAPRVMDPPLDMVCPRCGGRPRYDSHLDEYFCVSCWHTLTGVSADWDFETLLVGASPVEGEQCLERSAR